jgi:hypothetical protein
VAISGTTAMVCAQGHAKVAGGAIAFTKSATGWKQAPSSRALTPLSATRLATRWPSRGWRSSDQRQSDAQEHALRSRLGGKPQSDTHLAAPYRRFKRRFGTNSEGKAVFAVAHSMISSSGTSSTTTRPTKILDLTTSTGAMTPKRAAAISFASSNGLATASPSNQLPEPPAQPRNHRAFGPIAVAAHNSRKETSFVSARQ